MKQVSGHELAIGINKEKDFGHILSIGMGGIMIELYKDIAQAMLPVSKKEIKELLMKTKFYTILKGYRGMEKGNIKLLVDDVYKLCLLAEKEDIDVLEINPYILNSKKGYCVDIVMNIN